MSSDKIKLSCYELINAPVQSLQIREPSIRTVCLLGGAYCLLGKPVCHNPYLGLSDKFDIGSTAEGR